MSLSVLLLVAWSLLLLVLVMPRWRTWLVWPLLMVLGWVNLEQRGEMISPWDLRIVMAGDPELVTLRGRFVETPRQRIFERDEHESWRSHAVVQAEAIFRRGEWHPAVGSVAVTLPGVPGPEFFARREAEIKGVLGQPREAWAEGLFDYHRFLHWQGIYFQLQSESPQDWRLVDQGTSLRPPLADRFRAWAQQTLARGLPAEDQELRLLWAMSLGWKTALTDEVAEPFMRSGTMHIFAISGLHIALIAGILMAVLRAVQIPRGACGGVVIPLIWFYTMATGWQSSAIRSSLMMTIVVLGWALRRPGNLLNSLAAAGCLILVVEPRQLFQASFQLSFFVVLSIALLLPPLEKFRQRVLQTDPFLPDELRPRWQRWLDGPIRWVTTSLATSLAAWLGSLPLIAHYFHLFTPVSLLANLLVVPLASLALMCNLGALACGGWLPWFTEVFNHSGWFFMRGMLVCSHWVTTLPGAFWYVRAPLGWEIAGYYLLLLLLVTGWLWTPGKRLAAWGVGWAVVLVWLIGVWQQHDEVKVTVLGQGTGAVYCDAPGRDHDLLVDCGSATAGDALIKPFLRGQGVNRLPNIALTHGDSRRVGGFKVIAREFRPDKIWTSPAGSPSLIYRGVLADLKADPKCWHTVAAGETLASWEVLHPAADHQFARGDDNALVLRCEFHGVRILLLSEPGTMGQKALLARRTDLGADIIVAGMPDQGEPLGDELLAKVHPRLIILADAEFPVQKRSRPRLIDRLARSGVPMLRLAETGSLTLRFASDRVVVTTVGGAELAGWTSLK